MNVSKTPPNRKNIAEKEKYTPAFTSLSTQLCFPILKKILASYSDYTFLHESKITYHKITKDINILERVQRRVTKIVSNIRHLNYAERCKAFGSTTLVYRRQRGDLIQMYKVVNNIDRINKHNKPILRPLRTVRHRSHFVEEIIKNCEIRNQFFTNRIINH